MPHEMPAFFRSCRTSPRRGGGAWRLRGAGVVLGGALLPLVVLPAGAQMLIYEAPYGSAPYPGRDYGYEVPGQIPPRVPRYSMLPPREIMAIVRGMGYRQVSLPRLSGGFYVVTAVDEEGAVALRVNAMTGRVVSARPIHGGPTIAIPEPSPRGAPAAPRPAAPSVARVVPAPPATAPLPPPRPPEASVAAITPAPEPEPAPAPAASPPAGPPAPATSATPAGSNAGSAPAPQASQAPPAPVNRKAGTGTGGGASAGTASVLSRPKSSN